MSNIDLSDSDAPHVPPKRDLSFYVVFLAAVLPIWSLVPLSWIVVIHALYSGKVWSLALEGRIFYFIALCEVSQSHQQTSISRH